MARIFSSIAIISFVLATGCRQKMADTPRYEAYERSTFFRDSMSARPLVEGVVSRSGVRYGDRFPTYASDTASGQGGAQRRTMPFAATEQVLERGQQQFNVYCSPCHGRLGNGNGMIVQRGLRKPSSFHTERLRNAPLSHFYDVMTTGYGAMYSYANRTSRHDRWAIAAYIRALQLSQNATIEVVPPNKRSELGTIQP